MAILDLHVFSIGTSPAKADAELIVHPDAPLACAIAFQLGRANPICGALRGLRMGTPR
jgi:hypothetical protein